MLKPVRPWLLLLALPLALPAPPATAAAAAGRSPGAAEADGADEAEELEERSSSRDGRVVIDGETVEYTATVGDIVLRDEDGKPRAKMTFVSCDLEFRHSAGARVRPWDYHEEQPRLSYGTNAYANYAEHLRSAMHENPYLQVLVMSGYYDLATPYFASDYTPPTCISTSRSATI